MSATTTTRPSPSSPWGASAYFSTTPLGFPGRACSPPPSAGQQHTESERSPRFSDSTSSSYFSIPVSHSRSPSNATLAPSSATTAPLWAASPWQNVPKKQDDGTALLAVRPYATPQAEPSLASLTAPRLFAAANRPARPSVDFRTFSGPAAAKSWTLQRAETAPAAVGQDGVKMITGHDCVQLLMSFPDQTLLLDVRPSAQYSEARIKKSLNLCIPTTLLKRPSFNLQKVENTLGNEEHKKKLRQWQSCTRIIAYDSGTSTLTDASTLVSVLKKFTAEGWKGELLVLQGGFSQFSAAFPDWLEEGQCPSKPHDKSFSISLKLPNPPSISSPSATSHNPLCRTIRQNIDLIDGVGQIPVKLPPSMSESKKQSLPKWLAQASDRQDSGKAVAKKFLDIERSEQRRMQQALTDGGMYSAPPSNSPNKQVFRIAGIEKGLKNRYSNIYPYNHSRVKLQDTSSDCCDYINANHAQASRSNKRYIATQAPLPSTFDVSFPSAGHEWSGI